MAIVQSKSFKELQDIYTTCSILDYCYLSAAKSNIRAMIYTIPYQDCWKLLIEWTRFVREQPRVVIFLTNPKIDFV